MHDGAVIIRHYRVLAAACILPLTSSYMSDRRLGLRHRAAIGITEATDALAVVVSEEHGTISIAHNGRIIRRLDAARLEMILRAFYQLDRRQQASSRLTRSLRRWPGPAERTATAARPLPQIPRRLRRDGERMNARRLTHSVGACRQSAAGAYSGGAGVDCGRTAGQSRALSARSRTHPDHAAESSGWNDDLRRPVPAPCG